MKYEPILVRPGITRRHHTRRQVGLHSSCCRCSACRGAERRALRAELAAPAIGAALGLLAVAAIAVLQNWRALVAAMGGL